ncbi:LapA family protein [Crocosphaera sp.]|uniref:LapA family protein n=1 Tax=Crocosphaera sp. TaxID=2729996 RepID=UPI003F22A4DB
MRLIVLVLMSIGTVLMMLQNQQPVTLYFLGTNTQTALWSQQLPLGIWMIGFTLAGMLTSVLIQLLTRSPSIPSPRKRRNPGSQPQNSPEIPYERPEQKKSDWETPPPREWENPPQEAEDEEWDIEEPPVEQTIPQTQRDIDETRSEFEVQQPPQTSSQEGTVYSYTYGELSDRVRESDPPQNPPVVEKQPPMMDKKPPTNDGVYEAKYRVITPPYRSDQDTDDDDEKESWI